MLMQNRLCRLALTYSNEDHHCFVQHQLFVPPYREEDSGHFAKRLLTAVALTEFQPSIAADHSIHKVPDVQIGTPQHIRLWAQVDIPDQRHLQRAFHRSDFVLLCTKPDDLTRHQDLLHHPKIVCALYSADLITQIEQWIKPAMQWSVWREGDQMQLTDGNQWLEFDFPLEQIEQRLEQIH